MYIMFLGMFNPKSGISSNLFYFYKNLALQILASIPFLGEYMLVKWGVTIQLYRQI